MLEEEAEEIDTALWAASRALHEHADLASRSARRSRETGSHRIVERFDANAREALEQVEVIKTILLERDAAGG